MFEMVFPLLLQYFTKHICGLITKCIQCRGADYLFATFKYFLKGSISLSYKVNKVYRFASLFTKTIQKEH